MTPAEQLKQALTRPDGSPIDLDRVEIEILPGGRFRWNIWADGRRVFSDAADASQVCGMLTCTGILINSALGVAPPMMSRVERN